MALVKLARREAEGALGAICRKAAQGNIAAMALYCEHILPRLWPLRRGAPVSFDLGDASDSGAMLTAIARAVAGGELTPEEGERVGAVMRIKVEAADQSDMLRILKRLEAGSAWVSGDGDVAPHSAGGGSNGSDRRGAAGSGVHGG
jgi:hypothetical protein